MANVVVCDPNIVTDAVFGQASNGVKNYIMQRVSQVKNSMVDIRDQFADRWQRTVENVIKPINQGKIDNLRNQIDNGDGFNGIRTIKSLSSLQTANESEQRYILVCPAVRRYHKLDMLDAYGHVYKKEDGEGEDNYDYRQITNGVVVKSEQGYKAVCYQEELKEDDKPLDLSDRLNISIAWLIAEEAIENGIDPTSIDNNDI